MADKEIRTFIAPLIDGFMMLPNSAVAEVLAFERPEPFKQAPVWLLGELGWRDWQVPVICFEQMIEKNSRTSVTPKARILIIKTLGESTQVNFIGLVIQGLPKLKKVTASSLVEKQTDNLPKILFSKVSIDGLEAVIPELGNLTYMVEQAAYGS
jgi:chemosensory pili system protein ChpC